ncbi:MAG: ATP-dependent Clp protease adapter ClpS [Alphaproteobacteria bacterium]|nr:ATP-dependent Clp protease adapter ClpS [Alphaproteobacteria bacterium]
MLIPAPHRNIAASPPRAAGPDDDGPSRGDDREGSLALKERTKLKKPKMYKVLLHNDHYTTMEFVVYVLQRVFRHSDAEATRIMLHIHTSGIGVAGVFTREIAETKSRKVIELARRADFPLQCTYEEA